MDESGILWEKVWKEFFVLLVLYRVKEKMHSEIVLIIYQLKWYSPNSVICLVRCWSYYWPTSFQSCLSASFISCNEYKKARGLVVLGEGKGAVML